MPVYIFRVANPSAPPSLVRAFPKEVSGGADAYTFAKALLKRLKSASSADGDAFYKVYGATEKAAQKRLTKQLSPSSPQSASHVVGARRR